jgi:hypothetical protein
MTHPDILHAERTGYPHTTLFAERGDYLRECRACGRFDALLDEYYHCEHCCSVKCLLCKKDECADEMENGICPACLNSYANEQKIAFEYAKHIGYELAAQSIAENMAWEIFNVHCQDNGEKVYTHYQFFVQETNASIYAGFLRNVVNLPKFHTVPTTVMHKCFHMGLREFCLDDRGEFAEWLSKREVTA